MKKYKLIFIVLIVFTVLCSACENTDCYKTSIDGDPIATVNGVGIYKSELDVWEKVYTESEKEMKRFIEEGLISGASINPDAVTITREEKLNSIIEDEVVYQYALKNGFDSYRDEAEAAVKADLTEIPEGTPECMLELREKLIQLRYDTLKMSEDEWIEYSTIIRSRSITAARFKEDYIQKYANEHVDENPTDAYERFVQELMDDADIVMR